jgi:hypothetical protein
MANFRGKTTKGVNLLVTFDANQAGNDKVTFAAAQVQQPSTDEIKKGAVLDTNPYLISNEKQGKEGNKFINHTIAYTKDQIKKMADAGKKNTDKDGKTYITCKADLVTAKDKEGKTIGYAINTKNDIVASDNKHDPIKVADYNAKKTIEAKEAAKAAREAAKSAPDVATPEVEAEQQADLS